MTYPLMLVLLVPVPSHGERNHFSIVGKFLQVEGHVSKRIFFGLRRSPFFGVHDYLCCYHFHIFGCFLSFQSQVLEIISHLLALEAGHSNHWVHKTSANGWVFLIEPLHMDFPSGNINVSPLLFLIQQAQKSLDLLLLGSHSIV